VSNDNLLKQRVENFDLGWRITLNKLYTQKKLIVVYKGQVLEEYDIIECCRHPKNDNSSYFILSKTENSYLKNKIIKTKTSNPCTIVSEITLMGF
jgi:hypothetical protein